MTMFYQSLPPSLIFNIQNFRRYSCHNQAAVFLLLHAMFHSVITLLHRPSLLQNFTPDVTLPLETSIDLSRSVRSPLYEFLIQHTYIKAMSSLPGQLLIWWFLAYYALAAYKTYYCTLPSWAFESSSLEPRTSTLIAGHQVSYSWFFWSRCRT